MSRNDKVISKYYNKSSKSKNGAKERNSKSKKEQFGPCKEPTLHGRNGGNDPQWYTKANGLTDAAFNINFSYPAGTLLNLGKPDSFQLNGYNTWGAPTIASYHLVPYFGYGSQPSSPLNIASQQLYTWVRHVNSGSRNYDANDLMLHVLGMADVYAVISHLRRAYGVATLFRSMNRAIPRQLLQAQGFDPDEVQGNLANFLFRLNILINKAGSLAIPKDLYLVARRAFAFTDIYTEGESIKDQLYQFVPEGFLKFVLDTDGAGKLEFVSTGNGVQTLDYWFNLADSMLNWYFRSEDSGIITGDLLKAYGEDGLIKLSTVEANYTITPVYHADVFEQMKNCTVLNCSKGYLADNLSVHQDSTKAYLESGLVLDFGIANSNIMQFGDSANGKIMAIETYSKMIPISVETPTPTVVDVVEATRLKLGFRELEQNMYAVIGGADFVNNITITFMNAGSDPYEAETQYGQVNTGTFYGYETAEPISGVPSNVWQRYTQHCAYWSAFRFAPYHQLWLLQIINNAGVTSFNQMNPVFRNWDFNNFTFTNVDVLERMHEAALYSLIYTKPIGIR